MLYTVHFNYLDILKFSMIIDAKSKEDALNIIKGAIADDRVFTFSPNSSIRLGCIQVKDIQSHFTVEKIEGQERIVSSKYSLIFDEDEDEIPTKPDTPSQLKLKR